MQGISRRTTKLHPATSPQLTKAGTSWTSNGVRHNPPSTYSSWYWGNWEPRSPPGSLLNMNGSTYTTLWWGYYYFASSSPSLLCLIINIPPAVSPSTSSSSAMPPSSASHWPALPTCLLMAKCSTGTTTQPYDGPQSAPSLLAAYSSISSLPSAILTINSMYSNCAPSVWVSYSIFC